MLINHPWGSVTISHDDVIKWKHFPRNWPFVWGIHRDRWIPRTKGQWRGALMFSLICVWINGWVKNRWAGDLIRHRGHFDVNVMLRAILEEIPQPSSIEISFKIAYQNISFWYSTGSIGYADRICTPWWRHEMEAFSALLALCAENSLITGDFPSQMVSDPNFDVSLVWARISC